MNEAKRVAVFTNNKRDPDYSYLRKTVYTLLAAGAEVLADMRYRSCLGESRDGVKLCSYTEEISRRSKRTIFQSSRSLSAEITRSTKE